MASGQKGNIKCRQVQHLYVPQYEELTIETITAWARQNYRQFCDRYFPVDRELLKYPRQYVINCINTNIGEPFRKWVREQIELRNERLLKQGDMINMDPETYEAYERSQNVSCKYPPPPPC
jgi:hypothetical protein